MSFTKDETILRDLAKEYAEIAAKPVQDERRDLWRRHNSLERTRPLVLVMPAGRAWNETRAVDTQCEDPFCLTFERTLRRKIYMDFIGDDTIAEPWITMSAVRPWNHEGPWGPVEGHIPSPDPNGAWRFDPPIKRLEDIRLLAEPNHQVDEAATEEVRKRLEGIVGDVLPVAVTRAPRWTGWRADISTDLAQLRGLDQVMMDMAENPEWLHGLVSRMSAGVLRAQDQAEAAGHWTLLDHNNQAMPYCKELPPPSADGRSVPRSQLWCFFAAQEMTLVSPAMHEALILNYQLPIIRKYGLCAYGCCEDLTRKIDMLRKIPNLRRIGVTPVANVAKCAEQIGDEYVFSWRPNPSQMICCGFDPDGVKRIVKDAMEASRGCHVDITLKDIETVQGKPENLREWVRVVRSVTDEYA